MRAPHARILSAKKNWILSAERLRRVRHFLRRLRRAAARHLGSAAGSSYFKYSGLAKQVRTSMQCIACVGDSNAGAMSRELARPRGDAQPELCDGKAIGAGESLWADEIYFKVSSCGIPYANGYGSTGIRIHKTECRQRLAVCGLDDMAERQDGEPHEHTVGSFVRSQSARRRRIDQRR